MSDSDSTQRTTLALRLPVALVRLWAPDSGGSPPGALLESLPADSGITVLGRDRFAVQPVAGDPAVFDTAVYWCRRLLASPSRRGETLPLAALVMPGEALLDGAALAPVDSPLGRDLDRRPPPLEQGRIYLTAWGAKMLEQAYQLSPGPSYEGPSGTSAPTVEAGLAAPSLEPWRNPEILNRRIELVERPELVDRICAALAGPGLRLEGPPGCGKSRLLKRCLERRQTKHLWLRAQPARRGGPRLLGQLVRQVLVPSAAQRADPHYPNLADAERLRLREQFQKARTSGAASLTQWAVTAITRLGGAHEQPVYLVVDDSEQLEPGDLALIGQLLEAPGAGASFRPLLAGRGRPWPVALDRLGRLEVPPLSGQEMQQFGDRLLAGLSLPESVQQRVLDAAGGFPFALEEGMVELIRDKKVRRIYGSFFFGGQDSAEYRPSLRLVCHLEAEAARLGAAAPMRLAAVAATAVPAEELNAAAQFFGQPPATGWEQSVIEARLAVSRDSPWGPALEAACPAYGAALARGVRAEAAQEARRIVGELLAARGSSGEAGWGAYRLLRGTQEGVAALLAVLKTSFGKTLPREEVLASLTDELRRHQERDGHPATALKLLWQLLPVARSLGLLHEYEDDLARAVELAVSDPKLLLALASVKAEIEQEGGRYHDAENTIQNALKVAKGIDLRRQAMLLIQLGKLFIRQARYEEARQLFQNLGQTLEENNLPPLAASCRFYLGNIAMHENRLEEAAAQHQAALEQRRRQGLHGPAGLSLSALGAVALAQGNYPEALASYEEAHKLLAEHGKPTDISYTLLGAGRALTLLGDYTGAAKPLRQTLELRLGRDDVAGESIARLEVAKNYLHLGQPEAALKEAREAHFHLQILSLAVPTADAETLLGRIRLAQRRHDEAKKHLTTALAAHRRLEQEHSAAFDLAWLLDIAIATGETEGVRRHAIDLKALLDRLQQPDMGERLHLRMFRGLEYLKAHGHKVVGVRAHLEEAYREVLRKAGHLDPEARHRFLLQIDPNHAIVEAAARLGLAAQLQPG